MSLFIGPHVNRCHAPAGSGIVEHILGAKGEAAAEGFNVNTFQVFLAGPRSRKIITSDEEIANLRELARSGNRIFAHGTYTDVPWSGKPHAAFFIREELKLCRKAGISGLVVHLPSKPHSVVFDNIDSILVRDGPPVPPILFEIPHSRHKVNPYIHPDDLRRFIRSLGRKDPGFRRTGICIDVGHLWSSNVDVSGFDEMDGWLKSVDLPSSLPEGRILFHLNDSLNAMGDGRDAHAPLFEGNIWSRFKKTPKRSGVCSLIRYSVRHKIPIILERKPKEALLSDYAYLKRILA